MSDDRMHAEFDAWADDFRASTGRTMLDALPAGPAFEAGWKAAKADVCGDTWGGHHHCILPKQHFQIRHNDGFTDWLPDWWPAPTSSGTSKDG